MPMEIIWGGKCGMHAPSCRPKHNELKNL